MDRRPTLADVVAQAGVSTALVSIVMREAPGASATTRERVLAVADGLGYRPDIRAQLLRRSRSRLIGVVFGVQHAFHGDLVGGLYTAAERVGYELALSAVTPGRDEQRAVAASCATAARRWYCSVRRPPPATSRGWPRKCRWSSSPGRCGTGRWTSSGRTTRRASNRPSTISWSSGTGPSRTSTAGGRRGRRTPPWLHRRAAPARAGAQRADAAGRPDRRRRRRRGPQPARAVRSPLADRRHRVQRPVRHGRPGRPAWRGGGGAEGHERGGVRRQ